MYTTQSSPGEGLGCFSTEIIPAGTRILAETPLFNVREPRSNAYVVAAFSHLTKAQQQQYLTLHALDPDSQGTSLVIDIFNTNAWQTESRTSISLLAARFNHSCVPNATFAWNNQLSQITVHAVVTIPAHTQIYLSYERPYQISSTRHEKLSAYGFACSCPACSSDSTTSDIRRTRMVVLDRKIRVGRKQKWRSPWPKEELELIELLKEEGLMGEALGLAYHDAAVGWKKFGRLDLAARYAGRELEVCTMCYGRDSPYVDTTTAFLRELVCVDVNN